MFADIYIHIMLLLITTMRPPPLDRPHGMAPRKKTDVLALSAAHCTEPMYPAPVCADY
jgi:hypothetical protein